MISIKQEQIKKKQFLKEIQKYHQSFQLSRNFHILQVNTQQQDSQSVEDTDTINTNQVIILGCDVRSTITTPHIHPFCSIGSLKIKLKGKKQFIFGTAFMITLQYALTTAHSFLSDKHKQNDIQSITLSFFNRESKDPIKFQIQLDSFAVSQKYDKTKENYLFDLCILKINTKNDENKEALMKEIGFIRMSKQYRQNVLKPYMISGYCVKQTDEPPFQQKAVRNFIQKIIKGLMYYNHTTQPGHSGSPILFRPDNSKNQYFFVGIHTGSTTFEGCVINRGEFLDKEKMQQISALIQNLGGQSYDKEIQKINKQIYEHMKKNMNQDKISLNFQKDEIQIQIQQNYEKKLRQIRKQTNFKASSNIKPRQKSIKVIYNQEKKDQYNKNNIKKIEKKFSIPNDRTKITKTTICATIQQEIKEISQPLKKTQYVNSINSDQSKQNQEMFQIWIIIKVKKNNLMFYKQKDYVKRMDNSQSLSNQEVQVWEKKIIHKNQLQSINQKNDQQLKQNLKSLNNTQKTNNSLKIEEQKTNDTLENDKTESPNNNEIKQNYDSFNIIDKNEIPAKRNVQQKLQLQKCCRSIFFCC